MFLFYYFFFFWSEPQTAFLLLWPPTKTIIYVNCFTMCRHTDVWCVWINFETFETSFKMQSLLLKWPTLQPLQALELLDFKNADQEVRSFAVKCLKQFRYINAIADSIIIYIGARQHKWLCARTLVWKVAGSNPGSGPNWKTFLFTQQ